MSYRFLIIILRVLVRKSYRLLTADLP